MRHVILELRSGRRCRLVPNPTNPSMLGVYELEALPSTANVAERIGRQTIESLESRGLVLITPTGVTLKGQIGGQPIKCAEICCPTCKHTIEIALEASDAGPNAILVQFSKGT